MGCHELRRLLMSDWYEDDAIRNEVIAHIGTCTWCRQGLLELADDMLSYDTLSCEQCRRLFPAFYEATRPDHPLVEMDTKTMAQMVSHLSHCEACREEYSALLLLSKLEERAEY